jgi:signal transduction histidine kinase
MKAEEQGTGIVLLCDQQGFVQEILYDGLGLAYRISVGQLWVRIVDEASVQKAHNFLAELQTRQAAFDWELNVPSEGQVSSFHFTGAALGEYLLIVAARTNHGAAQLFEEFARIGNEQANALRAALKEKAELSRLRVERDSTLFDEISLLNNELLTLQRELAKRNVELARLNELKNRFLGMAAHDLRNPLYIIMAFGDILLESAAAQSPEQEYLQHIVTAGEFMSQIIDDFLSVAIIESGRLRLNLEAVNLPDIVEQVMILVGPKARKKNIEIVITHDPALPTLVADGKKVQQVLINLLSNAIEHSYPASSVALRTRRADDMAVIAVQDHGVGIAPQDIGRLFDPFEKKKSSKTGGEKSTGLGLTISRQVVTRHGGKIWVESEAGKGSTFFVALPFQPPEDIV